jgi:hypothetical protein
MGEPIGFGPYVRIDGPLPVPPPYGLLQAAAAPAAGVRIVVDTPEGAVEDLNDLSSTGETMDEAIARLKREGILPATAGDLRWLNGAQVFPYPPGQPKTYDACNPSGSTEATKDFGADLERPEFAPVTIYLAETCTSYKVWDQAAFRARAVTALTAVQGSAIARNLLTGEANGFSPHLADANANCIFPNLDAATNPMNALSILDNAIGLTGKLGLIHCSPGMADALRDRFSIDDRGGVLRTINGNVVIPDAGYTRPFGDPEVGTPHGHTAAIGTQEWVYATGPIDIRLSEMFVMPEDVSQALDRGTPDSATTGRSNSITYRAERYSLAVFDTELQVAVLADRCMTGCTG